MSTTRRSFLKGALAFSGLVVAGPFCALADKPKVAPAEPPKIIPVERPKFLLCNGQTLSRAKYPELYAVLGTAYGETRAGTFNTPDAHVLFGRHMMVTDDGRAMTKTLIKTYDPDPADGVFGLPTGSLIEMLA